MFDLYFQNGCYKPRDSIVLICVAELTKENNTLPDI